MIEKIERIDALPDQNPPSGTAYVQLGCQACRNACALQITLEAIAPSRDPDYKQVLGMVDGLPLSELHPAYSTVPIDVCYATEACLNAALIAEAAADVIRIFGSAEPR